LYVPFKNIDRSICNTDSRLAECKDNLNQAARKKNDVQEALHTCNNHFKTEKRAFEQKADEYQNQIDIQSQNVIESESNYAELELKNKELESQIQDLKNKIGELGDQVSNCDDHIVKYQQKIQDVQREHDAIYCADPLLFFSGYILATLIIFIICLVKFIRFQIRNRQRSQKQRQNAHNNMEKIEIRNESTNATSTRSISPKLNSAGLKTPSPKPRRMQRSRKSTPQITPRSDEEVQSLMQSEKSNPYDLKIENSLLRSGDKIIL